ncbi:polyprenyl synthetase family protein [Alloscardovia theropitheci]|uniref:Polyprenyl synthetase family protein n=1 Tax=Alloscardovia theropitheci TaxID=2496842 RepID=A0A4R0QWN0_9BIFI|nr:polyprenyl synthetase family protein [Alloscardovia theropitheci]TCD54837.1 polyprenyl synthetase family protein [Alloscardovia theropitheci]
MTNLTQHDIDKRLEEIVSAAWAHNMQHFPAVTVSEVSKVLEYVGKQAVTSSRGGKRLRALLLHETAHTFAENTRDVIFTQEHERAIIDLAVAIEIFQTAALIHDDIIDDADTRRGKPSAHRALETHMSNNHQGSGLALMLGDLLATLSIRTAHTSSDIFSQSSTIFQTFLDMHDQVELGQIMDVSMESLDLDHCDKLEESITATYINKTASYTTVAPLEIGLLASESLQGIESAHSVALSAGQKLGIAFQIHDDLIDLISNPEQTGKPVGGDIREGKRTYILAQALKLANSTQRDYLIHSYLDNEIRTQSQIDHIRDIFISSGAIEASITAVDELWNSAAQEILALCMACDISPEMTQNYLHTCQRFVA